MLATLLDRAEGVALPLPPGLATRYGGPLRAPARSPWIFANFVSTIDGVVSYDTPGLEAAAQISAGHAGDRFVLALLRAVADAVIVGAGTLRKESASIWTPESVFPEAGEDFQQLRAALGRPPQPLTVIVSASGEVDLALPAFHAGTPVLVATTDAGARRLGAPPPGVTIRAIAASAPLASAALVRLAMEQSGGERLLTEGGPRLLGQLVRDGLVDDLFLTVAPRLAGRSADRHRLALVEGTAFDPPEAPWTRLVGVKASDDYLFTRRTFAGRGGAVERAGD